MQRRPGGDPGEPIDDRSGDIDRSLEVATEVLSPLAGAIPDDSPERDPTRRLWFALQTVTTVGYGDVTPRQADGRFIAAVVMLAGIGFLAVITASVTASLVESSRRRFAAQSETDVTRRLEEVSERLARIEAAVDQPAPPSSSDNR